MGNFNRGSSDRGRSFGGSRGFGGGRPMRPATMYKAVCSKCGKDCEIPFQPTNGRPVFCRDCFRANAAASDTRPYGERTPARPTSDGNTEYSHLKDQLASMNAKLEKIMNLLAPAAPAEEALAVTEEKTVPEKKKRVAKKVQV